MLYYESNKMEENQTDIKKYFPALTGVRFVLALWVIIHHLTNDGQLLSELAHRLPEPIFVLIRSGYLAVPMFFILSGFVLAHSYPIIKWKRGHLLNYYWGRFIRIYPVYILSLIVIMPFIIMDTTLNKVGYLFNYLALLQGWTSNIIGWNTPAWSLSCEIFFYALFPLLITFILKRNIRALIIITIIIFAAMRLFFILELYNSLKPIFYFSYFIMGIILCRIFESIPKNNKSIGTWIYIPSFILLLMFIMWPQILNNRLDMGTTTLLLYSLFLLGLALGGGWLARFLSLSVNIYLGKASYAMYILHIPLLWWYLRFAHTPNAVIYISLVIIISVFTYRYFEDPANKYLRFKKFT